jgi:Phytanoyl-CoA dioxygenase (PhyH)
MKQGSLSRIPGVSRIGEKVRGYYSTKRFTWPIYDLLYYFFNKEPKELYRKEQAQITRTSSAQKVIHELKQKGVSVIDFSDLLPAWQFSDLQETAEALIKKPVIQERIKAIECGARPETKSDKFYLVRPLGDVPVVDLRDRFMQISLSHPILSIVCGYFGMFSRLAGVELWYNVPTNGPDVFSQRWHRDSEDRKNVKVFLYLRDVDSATGPFCYIPETHNGGRYKRFFPQTIETSNYPPEGAVEKKFAMVEKKVCVGKAGTLIFADTTGFHKGGHPTARGRLLFTAYYTTNASLPMITRERRYSIVGSHGGKSSPAAEYAIGHVER